MLYSVSVQASTSTTDTFDAIRNRVIAWAFPSGDVPDRLTEAAGETVLDEKRIAWDLVNVAGGEHHLWSLEVCSPLPESSDAEFVCAVVVSKAGETIGLQVDLGRRSSVARIAPAPLEFVDRPRVVPAVLNSVACQYGPGEAVAARPRHAMAADIDAIIRLLASSERRLPVFIVSSTAQGSAEARFASAAADRLAGLAHVVLLETWLALDALNARYPKTVPLRGARLFWPPAAAAERHPWWTAAQLRNASVVSRQLFHDVVAPVRRG